MRHGERVGRHGDLAFGLDLLVAADGRMAVVLARHQRTTARRVHETVERHPGRPGSSDLNRLATRYANIPYHRTRSDPEGRALEVLHDAGIPPPLVNHRVAKEEADLVWLDAKRIIEIDGPQYHRFAEELKQHVKARLAMYKYPRWVAFVSELPKTATGKIQRYKLRQ